MVASKGPIKVVRGRGSRELSGARFRAQLSTTHCAAPGLWILPALGDSGDQLQGLAHVGHAVGLQILPAKLLDLHRAGHVSAGAAGELQSAHHHLGVGIFGRGILHVGQRFADRIVE